MSRVTATKDALATVATDAKLPTGTSNKARLALLTTQQINVLEYASQGLGIKATAANMGLSEKGVKFHRTGIYKTLGVNSIVQALLVYQAITADTHFELLDGKYRTPSYFRMKAELVELRTKHIAALDENAKLRNDFKTVMQKNFSTGTTLLPDLISGHGNTTSADKEVSRDRN